MKANEPDYKEKWHRACDQIDWLKKYIDDLDAMLDNAGIPATEGGKQIMLSDRLRLVLESHHESQ